MEELLDIEGNVIEVGNVVYYARKRDYTANGELLKTTVTDIKNGKVIMGKYVSTYPKTQILVVK
jgi:hypothetical protein